jgi:hypothetical protein
MLILCSAGAGGKACRFSAREGQRRQALQRGERE